MAPVDRVPGDAALWSRAAHGDHDAFGQLFDRHAGAVYSYLFRLTANWSEAEDLTSAVFLQARRRRAEVGSGPAPDRPHRGRRPAAGGTAH
jgi:RNA polymerase sigma-70 factor, ECF subfamily